MNFFTKKRAIDKAKIVKIYEMNPKKLKTFKFFKI